jgi:hypothetical protein
MALKQTIADAQAAPPRIDFTAFHLFRRMVPISLCRQAFVGRGRPQPQHPGTTLFTDLVGSFDQSQAT